MNIVLIGMPGSGKSTVGAKVAARMGRPFVETDALIEAREGSPIPEIFAKKGEGYFRDVESAAVLEAAGLTNAVISTGGGVVLRPENMAALAATGIIFFLDRPPEDIAGENHSGRPLLAGDRGRVFELYTQRIALYRKYGAYTITSGNRAGESFHKLLAILEKEGLL